MVASGRRIGQVAEMQLRIFFSFTGLLLVCVLIAGTANARDECYDAKVLGTIVSQREGKVGECKGCIYFEVPFALEIEVKKVLDGTVKSSRLAVRSIQHMAEPPLPRTWWLRRNSAGSYNRVEYGQGSQARRCSMKAPVAKPLPSEYR